MGMREKVCCRVGQCSAAHTGDSQSPSAIVQGKSTVTEKGERKEETYDDMS
jgi:hypothetical protein